MISPTFFFLFSQLGVGMMLTLAFLSPRTIGNGFFKFASLTAAILMAVVIGFNFLFPSSFRMSPWPVVFLVTATVLTAIYNRVVGMDKFRAASTLLAASIIAGLISIAADSLSFNRLLALGGWEQGMLLVNHLAATAILGSVMLTMVFGHWYLVIPRLSIDHLRRLTVVLMVAVGLRVGTVAATLLVLKLKQGIPLAEIAGVLMLQQGMFFWPRVLFGVLIPIVLCAMIWNTVQLKHTQAATGLLYLAVVAVLFGEFFSKFLLFELQLPI